MLALVGWTFVMWVWMYTTRIPAMRRARIDVDALSRTGARLELPPEVARVADNHNHLHEQPTVFHATTFSAALLGMDDKVSITLAWGYAGIRIVHALVQATRNIILVRLLVLAAGSVVLFLLFLRTASTALG